VIANFNRGNLRVVDKYARYLLRPREEQSIDLPLFEVGENFRLFHVVFAKALIAFVSILSVKQDCEETWGFELKMSHRETA
jgi:hypothetical protein